MKIHLFLFALLISFSQSSCFLSNCGETEPPTTCIDDKIEAFKTEPGADSIYEYDTPDGKQYLFQHACVDCGDYVYDTDCNVVCVTNFEGYDPGTVTCSQSFFDSPRTEIWKK